MIQYGFQKATSFTKKQINVIFAKAKSGVLHVEKWFMQKMYDLADYYGYDYNASVADQEGFILSILDEVFASNMEAAQKKINNAEDIFFNRYTFKKQQEIDRTVFVR